MLTEVSRLASRQPALQNAGLPVCSGRVDAIHVLMLQQMCNNGHDLLGVLCWKSYARIRNSSHASCLTLYPTGELLVIPPLSTTSCSFCCCRCCFQSIKSCSHLWSRLSLVQCTAYHRTDDIHIVAAECSESALKWKLSVYCGREFVYFRFRMLSRRSARMSCQTFTTYSWSGPKMTQRAMMSCSLMLRQR